MSVKKVLSPGSRAQHHRVVSVALMGVKLNKNIVQSLQTRWDLHVQQSMLLFRCRPTTIVQGRKSTGTQRDNLLENEVERRSPRTVGLPNET